MIFSFFSRWKKAGKATGITGGAGKLCTFDKDGNVVSAGVSADEFGGKLYAHYISVVGDNMTSGQSDLMLDFVLLSRSDAQLNTWAKLRDAVPQSKTLVAGSFYYNDAGIRFPAIYIYRQGSGSGARLTVETYLQTAMQLPPFFDINGTNIYAPTDTVKEI